MLERIKSSADLKKLNTDELEKLCEEIRRELIDGKGTQFDPKFADIMLSMMDDGFVAESSEDES